MYERIVTSGNLTEMSGWELRGDATKRTSRYRTVGREERSTGRSRVWAIQREQGAQLVLVHALTRDGCRCERREMVGVARARTNHEGILILRLIHGAYRCSWHRGLESRRRRVDH